MREIDESQIFALILVQHMFPYIYQLEKKKHLMNDEEIFQEFLQQVFDARIPSVYQVLAYLTEGIPIYGKITRISL